MESITNDVNDIAFLVIKFQKPLDQMLEKQP